MYTKLLNRAIEIEGLIRILRDGDSAPEVISLLKEKTAALAAAVAAMAVSDSSDTSSTSSCEDEGSAVSVGRIFRENAQEEPMPKKEEIPAAAIPAQVEDDIILSFEDEAPAAEPHAPTPKQTEPAPTPAPQRPSSAAVSAAAKEAPSLKSLFSLNDRFLFSRELFGGDMKMFDSTLKFIDGIKDFADIEDYFYSELEWNPEDPNVAAYLDIIRPHFPD